MKTWIQSTLFSNYPDRKSLHNKYKKFFDQDRIDQVMRLTSAMHEEESLLLRCYAILEDIVISPSCICGSKLKLHPDKLVYRKYCSRSCKHVDPKMRVKYEATCMERYGVSNASKTKEVINKRKRTNIERFGGSSPMSCETVRDKVRATTRARYGVDVCTQNPEVLKKVRNTIRERYGVDHVMHNCEIKKKVKETSLKKYGVDNPMKSEVIKEHHREIMLQKFGVENIGSVLEFKEKIARTNMERYGGKSSLVSQVVRDKVKKTMRERYNIDYPTSNSTILIKLKKVSKRVRGGASRLLKAFQRNNDWERIISFADLRWSNGDLYRTLGFTELDPIAPDYYYTKGMQLDHKFKHRKKFYKDRYNIAYMTERQIMEAEGWNRIWDCGKLKFVMLNL